MTGDVFGEVAIRGSWYDVATELCAQLQEVQVCGQDITRCKYRIQFQ